MSSAATMMAEPGGKQQQQSASISSSSSLLTTTSNSSVSPTSSLTSIATNSLTTSAEEFTVKALQQSAEDLPIRSHSISSNAELEAPQRSLLVSAPNAALMVAAGDEEKLVGPVAGEAFDLAAGAHETADFRGDIIEPTGATKENACSSSSSSSNSSSSSSSTSGVEVAESSSGGASRLERRSNSCSQADSLIANSECCSAAEQAPAPVVEDVANSISANIQTCSLSHESLAPNLLVPGGQSGEVDVAPLHANDVAIPNGGSVDNLLLASEPQVILVTQPFDKFAVVSSQSNATGKSPEPAQAGQAKPAPATPSSRFFSSKLNTGSLWSLLSVGSGFYPDESSGSGGDVDNHQTTTASAPPPPAPPVGSSTRSNMIDSAKQSESAAANKTSGGAIGFFSRVQFKKAGAQQQQPQQQQLLQSHSHSAVPTSSQPATGRAATLPRFRFTVKYFGSTILHKNFTLPMLEWIAKDIRRQTVRGAQSTSQRQLTFPARDIIFEIQANQLMAISCKDGHCIFVHSMQCVSKYAQLQYDPTCFSYLIRDNKESPYFCHVFQAKSANKVHDIFTAIREVTTRSQTRPDPSTSSSIQAPGASPMIGLQKSASTDYGSRNRSVGLFGDKTSLFAFPSTSPILNSRHHINQPVSVTPTATPASTISMSKPQLATTSTRQQASQDANAQFENSYQFEVLFVKKVKLQCRRVPSSFVDDALETLRSYEVLKGNESKVQLKGIGKRIISASVDERQEYDEAACQSPTLAGESSANLTTAQRQPNLNLQETEGQRRGSSSSLIIKNQDANNNREDSRESRSCQQSPVKVTCSMANADESQVVELGVATDSADLKETIRQPRQHQEIKKHQSMDSLKSIDSQWTVAKSKDAPNYANDFSPYSTITSNDLNERIAAIPVVSSSVSLDHETRQRLARQVRETIMATAASIKKDVYASGDKLDSSSSSKALDSLSCTAASSVPPIDDTWPDSAASNQATLVEGAEEENKDWASTTTHRRSSAANSILHQQSASNNFDLFRRASARQVVKNRTMLLLIGKDELCTISIDKHQVLFTKSFNSIVHCLQGNNNKDHFGLICRDSGKINPNAESYAGFVFKCQSDKVVREIMGALKQVIYNSQHNYHGYNSPYNPLNTMVGMQHAAAYAPQSPKLDRMPGTKTEFRAAEEPSVSLSLKRGFTNTIEINEAARGNRSSVSQSKSIDQQKAITPIVGSPPTIAGAAFASSKVNPIKSMFCDNCPLYWYHRLCCDIESLPAESSKTIILRRVDTSLTEKEQDEVYSRFSEFNIDSVDEHNEIFMSILRHQCERKQLKHNQSRTHLTAMAKNAALVKQSSTVGSILSRQSSSAQQYLTSEQTGSASSSETSESSARPNSAGHKRSGSSGASLAQIMGTSNQDFDQQTIISDASSAAMDNLIRAKNSISVSIENMLKRRASTKDDTNEKIPTNATNLPVRSGSFKSSSREMRAFESQVAKDNEADCVSGSLRRSQSTSDYNNSQHKQMSSTTSWRDSLSRTINDDLANPLVGLFRRRSSTFGSKCEEAVVDPIEKHSSSDNLNQSSYNKAVALNELATQPSSPNLSESRFKFAGSYKQQTPASQASGPSPSSMLSGAFWKKSIFDKIRQPTNEVVSTEKSSSHDAVDIRKTAVVNTEPKVAQRKRSREELRTLWRKAIIEQMTLNKMDKQNKQLQSMNNHDKGGGVTPEDSIQRLKLNYKDVIYAREALQVWQKLLEQDPTKKVDFVEVVRHVRMGVPKQCRGEAWMFLMNQYQLRHGTSFQPADSEFKGDANQSYRGLLSQLSMQQHEIFVDIGRTFPTHPYYSQYLSIGQLSLFNLLKAYSLLDQEVGYCQGLSFVAGILLLHVDSEDEAFELMRHLLFNFGLRRQYLPSMNALHLQLYQLTRLLRDHEYELFNHFDRYDISPSLYAAPWFLTLFASQFPLGFVSRLLDLIYLTGIEAIFRVSLNLLAHHRSSILECKSLESTMEFMRNNLVKISEKNLVKLFDKSLSLDLRNKLIDYEIEYTFYCAEDRARTSQSAVPHNPPSLETKSAKSTSEENGFESNNSTNDHDNESTSLMANATATIIIQHLLANNHLKSLRTNYTY